MKHKDIPDDVPYYYLQRDYLWVTKNIRKEGKIVWYNYSNKNPKSTTITAITQSNPLESIEEGAYVSCNSGFLLFTTDISLILEFLLENLDRLLGNKDKETCISTLKKIETIIENLEKDFKGLYI